MSSYASLQTTFNDRDCLVEALVEMGYSREHIEVHDTAQGLYGYHGDLRQQKANVIVRRQHVGGASNDIGWEKQSDGTYTQHISDYDSHKHNAKWLTGLKASYTQKRFEKEAQRQGLKFISREKINGKTIVKYLKVGA
jgi:hypothetical protein